MAWPLGYVFVLLDHLWTMYRLSVVLGIPTRIYRSRYLPLSHVAGMMVDIIVPVVVTATYPAWYTVHFARQYDLSKGTIGDRLRAVWLMT